MLANKYDELILFLFVTLIATLVQSADAQTPSNPDSNDSHLIINAVAFAVFFITFISLLYWVLCSPEAPVATELELGFQV